METEYRLKKYALVSRNIELSTYIGADVLRAEDAANKANRPMGKLSVKRGSLIKIKEFLSDSGKCIVQVLDFVRHDFIYENLYECPQSALINVSDDVWPYVINVQPERRLQVVNSKDQCRWLVQLKPNDLLSVKGELFKKEGTCYDCIVRYVGPVQEMHPVGYFFGLELLHLDNGRSPQAEKIPFATKYIQCDTSLCIFTTADWIIPISNEVKTKLSARQLINDTIERMCTAIVPTPTFTNTYTQRKEKKPKAKRPTAQFYDLPKPSNMSTTAELSATADKEATVSAEHIDSSLERRLQSANKNTDSNLGGAQKAVRKTGILKHPKTQNISEKHDTGFSNLPATVSINDKDIIVIDKDDIKDDNSVIVINPSHKDVDLADLLGNNWPANAGGAATILNRSQISTDVNEANRKLEIQKPTLTVENRQLETEATGAATSATTGESSYNSEEIKEIIEVPGTKLTIGSLVEVSDAEFPVDLYGVIRWIGIPPESKSLLVGIELEDDTNMKKIAATDGYYNGVRLFKCHEGRAIFVSPNKCNIDRRFMDVDSGTAGNKPANPSDAMFGHVDCQPVLGAVAPLRLHNLEELEDICGQFKGIQGHHNSCYLDATLFSMFTFTSVFDSLLYRCPDPQDISHYTEVQKVLRDEIVNPLRKNVFVRADRVMKLRKLLDQLSSVSGLTSEEKDPEEFLNSLLAQIMRVEPFLKLSSGQDSYFYQLFVEKDERLTFPTVQQLFEQSFHSSDIKLKEVPSCLIIQMPRFGKNYKMYPRILPSQVLDVTDIIDDSPRQCSVCGKLAEYECRECFGSLQVGSGLECTAFCQKCLNTVHLHAKRTNHAFRALSVPRDFKIMADHMVVPRLYMELFAVVCIETSHYVAFVKAGSGPDAPWCFFDSMADRKGEKNGYNIPEMITVRELPQWLSDEGARVVNETSTNDKVLPEHAKRLFCDAYMCMYQSTDVMMYH